MNNSVIKQNTFLYDKSIKQVTKVNTVTNSIKSNSLERTVNKDTISFSSTSKKGKSELRKEFEEVKSQQGGIGKAWDFVKNVFGSKAGSNKVEELIKQAEKGEISEEEAKEAIEKYKEGQKTCVDVVADMASGMLAVAAFALAVPTGGASLAVGLGMATAVGAGVKVGIKAGDAKATGKEYNGKDLLYDVATGGINGLLAPVTNGLGNTVTKTIGQKLGLKIVQEGAEEVAEQAVKQGFKQAAKSAVLNQTLVVAGGTVGKRAVALATGMAVDGAFGGASDNMVRAALNGENIFKAGIEGAVGGMIMAPLIGGGFRVAGKAGKALNNKITTKIVLPDGIKTKFNQGQVGDCALLATIDGMMNNPQTAKNIKKAITKTIGGDYNVKIGDQVVRVAKSSLSDEMLSDTTGIRIFEQAYKQLTGDIDGGFAEVVAKQFGLNPVHITKDSITDELLDKLSKNQGDTVLSFGAHVDANGTISEAGQRHYFTIKNIDPETKMVTLTSPVDTSVEIPMSYEQIKTMGISIDGGTTKAMDLPNVARSVDEVEFKGKKKAKDKTIILQEEDISLKDSSFKTVLEKSKYNIEEIEEAFALIDEEIVDAIKKTGDLFSSDEIFLIQEAFEISQGRYSLDEIIKHRGSLTRLEVSKIDIQGTPIKDLKHTLDDYVNKYVAFLEQDPQKLALSIKQLDYLIQEHGTSSVQQELYRGVKSQSEIARLFSLFDYKLANPDQAVIYRPGRLTSTTTTQDVIQKHYGTSCQLEIEIPQSHGNSTVKMLEVNKALSANDFSFQEEVLFPSDVEFEILSLYFKDGIPIFKVRLNN